MLILNKFHHKILPVRIAKKIIFVLIFIVIFDFFLFPMPVLASEFNEAINEGFEITSGISNSSTLTTINNLPNNNNLEVGWSGYYTMTAYNSEVSQCDGDPCITANGFDLCEHGVEDSVAANFLRFGTRIRMPELFGDRVFVVRDRMNARYQNRVDVWMLDKGDAKKFGIKVAKIEVLSEP